MILFNTMRSIMMNVNLELGYFIRGQFLVFLESE